MHFCYNVSMDDLISIIVPVYNSEEYLPECIDSIINQTYKNLQIILVDDCSKKSVADICDSYAKKDNRIEVIHRKKNGGQSAARNEGLQHVKGDWIAFADNDDILEQEMLETLLANALKYKVKVSGCANNRIENSTVKICDMNGRPSGIYDTKEIVKNILIDPKDTWVEIWTKLYHKSLIDNLYFPEGCQLEDYMVNLPLLLKVGKVYFDNKAMYNWYIRKSSQSDQMFFENRLTNFEVSGNLRKWFLDNKVDDEIINAAYVWELGVKAKLLEDMCKTGQHKYINNAKEKLSSVQELIPYANKCSEFKLKSKIHIKMRLSKVKKA